MHQNEDQGWEVGVKEATGEKVGLVVAQRGEERRATGGW